MVAPLSSSGPRSKPALDPRAAATGQAIAEAFGATTCAAIVGPSHSGKTQAAMAALDAIDPSGAQTVHTSAAILNTNAPVAPSDRSATWSSFDAIVERFREAAPRCVVIDEAGSSPAPVQPYDLAQARARALLTQWKDAGTKFIVIGHHLSETLEGWGQWLGAEGFTVVDAPTGTLRTRRARLEAGEPGANPVADKNVRGAEGRERLHRPLGNAFFARFGRDDD